MSDSIMTIKKTLADAVEISIREKRTVVLCAKYTEELYYSLLETEGYEDHAVYEDNERTGLTSLWDVWGDNGQGLSKWSLIIRVLY